MPEQKKVAGPVTPEPTVERAVDPAPRSPQQTCREVEQVLTREPLDRVKCAHLFGDYYRCNWWSRAGAARKTTDYDWAALLTDHIRQSRFLHVTVRGGQLVVDEVAEVPRRD